MFWRKRPTVDADTQAWALECWRWLDTVLGPVDADSGRDLVLPSSKRFPETPKAGHERAEYFFSLVREYCGMQEWPCELIAQEVRPRLDLSPIFAETSSSGALGTFQAHGNSAVITYDPGMLDNPIQLITTLVHELSHYLLLSQPSEPPGGSDLEELATDLASVHLGFGLFGANAAFNFSASNQGWSTSRSGYLSEATWCFANALFMELCDVEPSIYTGYVKSSVASQIAKNRSYLQSMPETIAGLRTNTSQIAP